MKYCKKCGILYSDILENCPKCSAALLAAPPKTAAGNPSNVRRQWIGLLLGIPALILFFYLIGRMISVFAVSQ